MTPRALDDPGLLHAGWGGVGWGGVGVDSSNLLFDSII